MIRLQKAKRATSLVKLRERRPPADAETLRVRISAWADEHVEMLRVAEPALPDELDARGQDIAEPLIAIADLLGCGTETRVAIVAIRTGESAAGSVPESVGVVVGLVELGQERDEHSRTSGRPAKPRPRPMSGASALRAAAYWDRVPPACVRFRPPASKLSPAGHGTQGVARPLAVLLV